MGSIWVVAASQQRARVFENGEAGTLTELEDLIDPEARLHTHELLDGQTPTQVNSSTGTRASEPKHNPKKEEAVRFAGRIADLLKGACQESRISKLYVLAEPTMLGMLRDALDPSTRKLVAAEVSRNLVAHTPAEIRAHLPAHL